MLCPCCHRITAGLVPLLLASLLALSGCFSEEDYSGCPFTPSQQKACTAQAGDNVEGINCVISEHPECVDGICIMYQGAEPFCSNRCVDDKDCAEGGVCVQFTMDCGISGTDCAKYCVLSAYLPQD